ncbi:hypothetical protein EV179_000057 [Coemansia sp. RSA 487]|nr:hypothetical protein EV179_000057 [Coemansia sp. RSA 487]
MALYSKQGTNAIVAATTQMLYLKESQELYENCEFISKKTRSIYAWRAALWVRYCKEHSMDFTVTEDKLIDYLDWLFEIDLVNKINTKKSYVPDILRDHMGSVICLWRIQTGNNPDMVSPKEGTRYQAKWDEILRNYPRRDKFQPRAYIPETQGFDSIGSGSGSTGPIMPSSIMYPTPALASSYNNSNHFRHYNYQQQQRQYGPIFPHQQPPYSYTRYHNQTHTYHAQEQQLHSGSHSPQYPVRLSEPMELEWQLRWLQSSGWAPNAARFLFTIAISTWTDATDVVGLRMMDARFASSTMAPRLPSSVLRISLTTNSAAGARPEQGAGALSGTASRQQFSIIRSRNPLFCAWNALATLLFYRWHIAEQPEPTFANASWQNMLVIPSAPNSPDMSTSPGLDARRNSTGLPAVAIESGRVSADERLDLVRDLLPPEMLPIERFGINVAPKASILA